MAGLRRVRRAAVRGPVPAEPAVREAAEVVTVAVYRVVAADGLGGFSGGDPGHELETKRGLLENEGALPPALV